MGTGPPIRLWSARDERIFRGGVPNSTEDRLRRLGAWGGSTSFLSTAGTAALSELGMEPVAQVVGASGGHVREGVIRTTQPGRGRRRRGESRILERSGEANSWAQARRRALDRLVAQAKLLKADAVISVRAERRQSEDLERHLIEVIFTGTAVRSRARRKPPDRPTLSLLGAQELLLLSRAGLEAAGIAGGSAHVQVWPGRQTVLTTASGGLSGNTELEDLTKGVYEARRLAMSRVEAEAKGLDAAGLVGVEMSHDEHPHSDTPSRALTLHVAIHVLGTAVRRRHTGQVSPDLVLGLSGGTG